MDFTMSLGPGGASCRGLFARDGCLKKAGICGKVMVAH